MAGLGDGSLLGSYFAISLFGNEKSTTEVMRFSWPAGRNLDEGW
ncbi:MAG: hypothetical protein AAB881_01265 [Patescibacteria group bacterium]